MSWGSSKKKGGGAWGNLASTLITVKSGSMWPLNPKL